ncbi:TonB-dependent receptor [Sphingomonas sp. GB1N7]|uniref:TonB-dependent receptor n=1 Tax=Parasphingomonas caseinilytica TaxID=3096158 RepID=UPI002FC7140E
MTARKRSETVQSIPVAIDVVTSQDLVRTGSASLLQIASVAPGLNLAKAPTGNEIGLTIRGLGSSPGAPSFDSSVSLFVDGVYAPRNREFAASMFDIQRIEVVKGTQAALLGKNTSLGAVNLLTRKPGDAFVVDARASYEFELGSKLLTGGVDIPLGETLKLRLSGQTLDDMGWVRNVISGKRNPRTSDDAIRGVLVWQPGSGIDVTAVAQHDISHNYGTPVELLTLPPSALLLQALAGAPGTLDGKLDQRNATSYGSLGGEQFERFRNDRYSLTANIPVGAATLTSVTAYSNYRDNNVSDSDFQAGDYLNRPVAERSKQFSQELRIVSPGKQAIDYVIGGLFLSNILDNQTTLTANYPFSPVPNVPLSGASTTYFYQKTQTLSAFGQATANISSAFRLVGGMRFTHDTKDVNFNRLVVIPGLYSLVVNPPYAPFSRSRRENNVDYSIGAQYDISSDIMAYASYGQGTKSGGFASSATFLDRSEYASERAHTAEVGIKAQDAARHWLLNISLFNTNVDNFQVVSFDGMAFQISNADLRSRGFELEGSWRPIDGLRLFVNNTYADAKDRQTGGPIPLAPKWSGSGGFNYQTAFVGTTTFALDGSVDYRSQRYYQQDPTASVPGESFTTLNLSAAISGAKEAWEVRLIGRNLANENAAAFTFLAPITGAQAAVSERSRTIALQLSVKY